MSLPRRQHAPLYATGLPVWVMDGLRAAGVMLEEWTSPKWRTESTRERLLDALLLFDSRTPASRDAAETAESRGFTTLNLAPIIHEAVQAAKSQSNDAEALPFAAAGTRELPPRVQQELARLGFYWARVADYPYPYQAALCDDRNSADDSETVTEPSVRQSPGIKRTQIFDLDDSNPAVTESEILLDDLQNRYALGQAMYVPSQISPETAEQISCTIRSESFPLLWKTSPDTFRDWRDFRKRIRFQMQSVEHKLHIHCDVRGDAFQPALEFWRGRHLAAVPLKPGDQMLDERSLIFQSAARRHQAGLAAFSSEIGRLRHSSSAVTHAL